MPLARPFISVSSVLMASIRAQMSIRKCIHSGNMSAARVNNAVLAPAPKGVTEPLPIAAMPAMPITKSEWDGDGGGSPQAAVQRPLAFHPYRPAATFRGGRRWK